MAQYALVDTNGNVINIIEWDGVTPHSVSGLATVPVAANAAIGGTYSNGTFTAPASLQPALTATQQKGIAIAQYEDMQTQRMVREAIAGATNTFPANHPNFPGMTSAQALASIQASISALRGS